MNTPIRKTKIVCTMGPNLFEKHLIAPLMKAGMNVARFNFSHGTYETHQHYYDEVCRIRDELGLPVATMLDTKGPEIRVRSFKNGRVTLQNGQLFTLTTDEVEGDEERVSITYKELPQDIAVGSSILIDDGLIGMQVEHINGADIVCRVLNGGVVSNNKGVNIPNAHLSMPFISEKDHQDILFAIKNGYDFIAASFTRCADDIMQIRHILQENNCHTINIIAKIENMEGVENIDEILRVVDGVMVARGDLGVEVPLEDVPSLQKKLIQRGIAAGKPVITATQMLDSMIKNPRPTRAEATDVANAIYDGTSAIMLSGETAAGEHPIEALSAMARIAEYTEAHINYAKRFPKTQFEIHDTLDAISHATCGMAIDIGAKVITVCSITGRTARLISRFRGPTDIIGLTTNERAYRKLALSWGITPVMSEVYESTDVLFYHALKVSRAVMQLEKGDKVIITGGIINGRSGNTNTIKVEYA